MTEYDIIIKGVENGLTKYTVEGIAEGQFPNAESVEVVESEASD